MASTPKPGEEPPGSSIEVADPDDYNRARRLRQVHDAREAFKNTFEEADEALSAEEITEDRFDERVADALIWYIIEVEPIIDARRRREEEIRDRKRREAEERGDDPEDVDLDDYSDYWDEREVDGPDGETFTLERIVEDDGVVDPDADEPNIIPSEVSKKAFRMVNRFMNESGFGLRFDKNLPGHPAETEWSL